MGWDSPANEERTDWWYLDAAAMEMFEVWSLSNIIQIDHTQLTSGLEKSVYYFQIQQNILLLELLVLQYLPNGNSDVNIKSQVQKTFGENED